jgi:hypothetical protein
MSITEYIKTNRPNLSASSLKTYSSVLRNLQKIWKERVLNGLVTMIRYSWISKRKLLKPREKQYSVYRNNETAKKYKALWWQWWNL